MKKENFHGVLVIMALFGVFCMAGISLSQNIDELPSPKVPQAITHIRLGNIEIIRGKIGATAMVGYLDDDNIFVGIEAVHMTWSKKTVADNLTVEEIATLVSIRAKVKAAIIAKFAAQP